MAKTPKLKHVANMGSILSRSPRQMVYLPRWLRALRRPPIETKLPWLPFTFIDFLQSRLTVGSRVFEYGGGGSTLWFAERAEEVVTVEHDNEWFAYLENVVSSRANCTLLHGGSADNYEQYIQAIGEFPDDHFDVVVVDGRERVRCFERAMAKVRPGGLLALDDTDRERYAPAFELAREWSHETFRGLAPYKAMAAHTTVWSKPKK